MDLFNTIPNHKLNLLPCDGEAYYHGSIMTFSIANMYFNKLINSINWKKDIAIIFGKRIESKRKVAWYGDKAFEYTYSNNTKLALPWTYELLELKRFAEERSGETFNSCLLNMYHNGSEGMSWHSDGERELKQNGAIASLSFGAERRFSFKHKKTKIKIDIVLERGSLLVMKGNTQTHWLHRLPPTKKNNNPRVNLTFRTIDDPIKDNNK